MDKKDLELYFEENRLALKELNASISNLVKVFNKQIAVDVKSASKTEVTGKLEVNTEKVVEVSNLELIRDELKQLADSVNESLKKYQPERLESIKVDNLDEIKQDSLKISNLDEIKQYFDNIADKIENNQPVLKVIKEELRLPTNPKEAIAVRLSDGKAFYNAITNAMTSAGGVANLFVGGQQVSSSNPVPIDIREANPIPTIENPYAMQVDEPNTSTTYQGWAAVGTATSAAGWRIRKITKTGNVTSITWADSNANFDNIWDDRTGLTYG